MTRDPDPRTPVDQADRDRIRFDHGRNLFVEAGAGTGKTTQLVDRIVQLVITDDDTRRVRLSQIAAITFTEAAAAELRDRIRARFEREERRWADAGDWAKKLRCGEALQDADSAAISTLHAFAHRLLSEFPVEVGIPPRVEVVDEVQSQVAFDERWSRFVDQLYADAAIEEFVIRASILRVGLGSSGRPLRNVAAIFDDNWDRLVEIESFAPEPLEIDWRPLADAARAVLAAQAWCTDLDDKGLAALEGYRPLLSRFVETSDDLERMRLLLRMVKMKVSYGKRANWGGRLDECKNLVTAMADRAKTMHDALANDTLTLLASRIAEFTVRSAEERRAEGVLEFHDLLVLARLLLRNSPEARSALAGRYRILMLDEFQDTDPIQIELALLLAGSITTPFRGEWRDLRAETGRLFMVGDPKQSIYRFRRADIEVFVDARHKFADGVIALHQNFRTVTPIIEAVNALFDEVMAEESRGQARYRPLTPWRDPSPVDHRPLVLGGPRELAAQELREAEAEEVAAVIDEIRHEPDRWLIEEHGEWRRPNLADVTVLLPARTSLGQLTDALGRRSIPYRADTGTLVYETQEIRDLLAVLAAIDDPSDEIALVAALRSPLYACGDDDLLRWRRAGGRWDFRDDGPDGMADSVVAEAYAHLSSLAERRWWEEPSALLMRVVDERGAMALATAGPRARDSWRRIRFVVDQARAFEEAGGGDLRAYLRWTQLQGVDGSKAHEPMLAEPDDDAVQIMTVHGSKGLEFPITIVSGLTTEFRPGARGVAVHWPKDTGRLPEVKLRADLRTSHFDLTADLEGEMDRHEKERLLYVALTRAQDHLIVSGFHRWRNGKPVRESHGRTVWEFFDRSANGGLVRRRDPAEHLSLFPAEDMSSGAGSSGSADLPGSRAPDGAPTVDVAAWAEVRARRLEAAARPHVLSATAIARQSAVVIPGEDDEPWADADEETALPPQSFRRGRAGTAIGSAVHGTLQILDLGDPGAEEVDRIAASQAWAESVPEHADQIAAAARSALRAPIVASCRENRHWKELFVAAPVNDRTIEGYIDLLVETGDGLVVVDYKTDAVATDAEVDVKLEQYALQGAAYAVALETATGRPVSAVQFVFTRAGDPIVRTLADLDEHRREVRRRLASSP